VHAQDNYRNDGERPAPAQAGAAGTPLSPAGSDGPCGKYAAKQAAASAVNALFPQVRYSGDLGQTTELIIRQSQGREELGKNCAVMAAVRASSCWRGQCG
jgi:hypothetical protein